MRLLSSGKQFLWLSVWFMSHSWVSILVYFTWCLVWNRFSRLWWFYRLVNKSTSPTQIWTYADLATSGMRVRKLVCIKKCNASFWDVTCMIYLVICMKKLHHFSFVWVLCARTPIFWLECEKSIEWLVIRLWSYTGPILYKFLLFLGCLTFSNFIHFFEMVQTFKFYMYSPRKKV